MSEQDILATIDDIADLVPRIDDVVEDETEGESEGQKVKAIRCDHGGNRYVVYAIEGNEFITVQYQYHALNDFIVAQLDDPEQYGETMTLDIEDDAEMIETANSKLDEFLNDLPDEVAERFYVEIIQRLKSGTTGYQIFEEGDNRVRGIQVTSKLFPLENDISLREFHRSVQSVMSIGIPARVYIQYSYGLGEYKGEKSILKESIEELTN